MPKTYIFYKKEAMLQPLRARFPQREVVPVRGEPTAALLAGKEADRIVFALPNDELQKATALCRDGGFAEVYAYPCDIGADPAEPIRIDPTKPRLDYLEIGVSHACNLNCRGCWSFANLAAGEGFYDYDVYRRDMRRMKTLFWGVAKIRLMGGEPLLNPRLADYVEFTRGLFPDADLRIVSNGLLIPSLSDETLRRIRRSNCSFDISNYAPTRRVKKEIVAALERFDIRYDVGVPMYYFFKNILERPAEDPAPAFRNCLFSHCHMLAEGVLAPCSVACCIYRFNDRFGTEYPEDDRLDLFDDRLDGWEILDAFSRPHPFCRCCGSGFLPVRWRGHVGAPAAKQSDWQIPDSFLHTTVAPLVQRAAKPAAVRLREAMQKKNNG